RCLASGAGCDRTVSRGVRPESPDATGSFTAAAGCGCRERRRCVWSVETACASRHRAGAGSAPPGVPHAVSGGLVLRDAVEPAVEIAEPALQIGDVLRAGEPDARQGLSGEAREPIDDDGPQAPLLGVELLDGLVGAFAGVAQDVERATVDHRGRVLPQPGDELPALGLRALHRSADVVERE